MLFVVDFSLDSSFVPPLIYAFIGSSRDIAIGPVAVVSLLIGTMAQNEIDLEKNALAYRRLVFTATFFAGVTQFALGFFRLYQTNRLWSTQASSLSSSMMEALEKQLL